MKKPLSPEVLALIPNGIENFVPRCWVCTAEIPKQRRTSLTRKGTCSPPCHAVWRLYKKFLLTSSRCRSCFHPSTPEERDLFRDWNRAREREAGIVRRKRGRPTLAEMARNEPNSATSDPNAS